MGMEESRSSILERIALAVEFLFCAFQLFEGVLTPGSSFGAFWCVCVYQGGVCCLVWVVCQVFCLLGFFVGFFFVVFWFCCFHLVLGIFGFSFFHSFHFHFIGVLFPKSLCMCISCCKNVHLCFCIVLVHIEISQLTAMLVYSTF